MGFITSTYDCEFKGSLQSKGGWGALKRLVKSTHNRVVISLIQSKVWITQSLKISPKGLHG